MILFASPPVAVSRSRITLPMIALFGVLAFSSVTPFKAEAQTLPEPIAPVHNPYSSAMGLLRCLAADRTVLASGHRGGPAAGYPENAIETFAHTLAQAPMLLEADVRTSADDRLVLMHDETVDRTTNGQGRVNDLTLAQLRALRLVDDHGTTTDFVIPTLDEAIDWARGRGLLVLDLKEDASIPAIAEAIRRKKARSFVMITLYRPAQARAFHHIDPDLTLIHPIVGLEDLEVLELAGVDIDNIVAWTGLEGVEPRDVELWRALRARGTPVTYGTLFVEDPKILASGDTAIFRDLADLGVDIMTSDLHMQAFGVLNTRRDTAAGLALCSSPAS